MREIKFRGLRLDGEWVYGYVFHDQYFLNGKPCTDVWLIRDDCDHDQMVKEGTIGQYTGLKDKEGNEIYEGDIVRYEMPGPPPGQLMIEYVEAVHFNVGSFDVDGMPLYVVEEQCEVIGNVFQNPELIKNT